MHLGSLSQTFSQCIAPSLAGTGFAVLLAVPSTPNISVFSDFLHVLKYCFRCNENQHKINFFLWHSIYFSIQTDDIGCCECWGCAVTAEQSLAAHQLLQTPPWVAQGLVTGRWVLWHLPQLLLSGSVNWASGPGASRSAHGYRYGLVGRGALLVTFQGLWPQMRRSHAPDLENWRNAAAWGCRWGVGSGGRRRSLCFCADESETVPLSPTLELLSQPVE